MGKAALGHSVAKTRRRFFKTAVGWGLIVLHPLPLGWASISSTPSLVEFLEEARQANPSLRAARKEAEAAQARIPLSRGWPAPRIGIEFEEIPKGTVRLDRANLMWQFIQALPFPAKLTARQKVAVKEAQMAAMAFKRMEWEVMTQVKEAYYDLFLLDRHLEIERELQIWLTQAVTAAEARYATGSISKIELLQIQGSVLQSANRIEVLQHRREAAQTHLNHLLSRPITNPIPRIPDLPLTPVPSDPETLIALAEEHQPELNRFRFALERAQAAWRLAKWELLPDLETMLELRDPALGPLGPWDLSLGIVMPFWFWTKQRYGVKVALSDKESAEAAFQAMRLEIARRIHAGWHKAKAAFQTAELYQKQLIPLKTQAIATALARYQTGQETTTNLVGLFKEWSEWRMAYVDHLIELEREIFLLEQAVGLPLRPWEMQSYTSEPSERKEAP